MMKKDEIAHLKRDNEQFLEEEKERLQTDSVQETAEVRQFYQIMIDGYAQGLCHVFSRGGGAVFVNVCVYECCIVFLFYCFLFSGQRDGFLWRVVNKHVFHLLTHCLEDQVEIHLDPDQIGTSYSHTSHCILNFEYLVLKTLS